MSFSTDLDPIFAFLLAVLSDFRELAISFHISALGFNFTLWHFWIALLIASILIPLLFKLTASSPLASVLGGFTSASERNRTKSNMEDK